jgi:drug/metabolite transporter (DMT)-like permease
LAILYTGWALATAVAAFAGGAAMTGGVDAAASAAAGWAAVRELWPGWRSGSAWAVLAFSAVGPGAVADLLQQVGQTAVGAAEANVILTSESLFTVGYLS